MILVDTSIWIEHFRTDLPRLRHLLNEREVFIHPFIIGELATGNLHDRSVILGSLNHLPMAPVCDHEVVLQFLHQRRLMGLGLGWIDLHILCAALLIRASIWTLDKTLGKVAASL